MDILFVVTLFACVAKGKSQLLLDFARSFCIYNNNNIYNNKYCYLKSFLDSILKDKIFESLLFLIYTIYTRLTQFISYTNKMCHFIT